MTIFININFFLSAKSNPGQEKIIRKINAFINENLECISIQKKDEAHFLVEISYDAWDRLVYRLLHFCQAMGKQWVITGSIEFELSAWSNHPAIVGVDSISLSVDNPIHSS